MDVLAYNADCPERLDIVGTRDKGLIGNVFGYSMTVDPDKFPSCKRCRYNRHLRVLQWNKKQIDNITLHTHSCLKCCDWNLEGTTKPFQDKFPANFKYPNTSSSKSPPFPE